MVKGVYIPGGGTFKMGKPINELAAAAAPLPTLQAARMAQSESLHESAVFCPICEHACSPLAVACPGCGHPIAAVSTRGQWEFVGAGIAVVAMLLCSVFIPGWLGQAIAGAFLLWYVIRGAVRSGVRRALDEHRDRG